jgi:hypothetical protein
MDKYKIKINKKLYDEFKYKKRVDFVLVDEITLKDKKKLQKKLSGEF